jgi:thiamine-monophosphate kinase
MIPHKEPKKRRLSEASGIGALLRHLPPNPHRLTVAHQADAELIKGQGDHFLFSMDEFSSEDHFRTHNPRTLGWNLAVASMSDILASGGHPKWYGHAITAPPGWDQDYLQELSQGIGLALQTAGAQFIGGDFSLGERWSYTASIQGSPGENALDRTGIQKGDKIYLSGKIGRGNFEAALYLYQEHTVLGPLTRGLDNRFPYRGEEAQLIGHYASGCIDTSDGTFSALNTLSHLNGLGYRLQKLPLLSLPKTLAHLFRRPPELLFLGGAGEYELLCAIPPDTEADFLLSAKAAGLKFYPLGEFVQEPEVKELHHQGMDRDLTPFCLEARSYADSREYLAHLQETWLSTEYQDNNRGGMGK